MTSRKVKKTQGRDRGRDAADETGDLTRRYAETQVGQ